MKKYANIYIGIEEHVIIPGTITSKYFKDLGRRKKKLGLHL